MRFLWFWFLISIVLPAQAADYVSGTMLDIVQYERGLTPQNKKDVVVHAFTNCVEADVKHFFFSEPFYAKDEKSGVWSYISNDSLRLQARLMRTCLFDLDGDRVHEVLFHEYNNDTHFQKTLILKKNNQQGYDVVLNEYGVISGMNFDSKMLKNLHISEMHAFFNPCDRIKIYQVKAGNGLLNITPHYAVNVPFNYMYPVKVSLPESVLQVATDTLYLYYKSLFKGRNFPYKIEIREQFEKASKFNSLETNWTVLIPRNYYFASFVEERDDFTAIMVAVNTSYGTPVPEYQFIYVPTVYILSR